MSFSRLYLVTFLFACISLNAQKVDYIFINQVDEWENLIDVCKKANKPILLKIDFTSGSKKEESAFLDDRKNVKFVNKTFVSLRTTSYSELGRTLQSLFLINGDFHYSILNTDEIMLIKSDSLNYTFIKEGVDRFNSYQELLSNYEKNGLNLKQWIQLLEISNYNLGYVETNKMARPFVKSLSDEDLNNPVLWSFITNNCIDVNNIVFNAIANSPMLVENDSTIFPWMVFYKNSYNLNLDFAITYQDSARLILIEEKLIPLYPDSNKTKQQIFQLHQQYLSGTSQWAAYENLTVNFLDSAAKDSVELYFLEIEKLMNFYSYDKVSKLSEKLLLSSLEVEETFNANMSLAQLEMNRGEYSKANEYAEKALENASSPKEKSEAFLLIQYLKY